MALGGWKGVLAWGMCLVWRERDISTSSFNYTSIHKVNAPSHGCLQWSCSVSWAWADFWLNIYISPVISFFFIEAVEFLLSEMWIWRRTLLKSLLSSSRRIRFLAGYHVLLSICAFIVILEKPYFGSDAASSPFLSRFTEHPSHNIMWLVTCHKLKPTYNTEYLNICPLKLSNETKNVQHSGVPCRHGCMVCTSSWSPLGGACSCAQWLAIA